MVSHFLLYLCTKYRFRATKNSSMRIVSHRRLVEFYQKDGRGDAKVALERCYTCSYGS